MSLVDPPAPPKFRREHAASKSIPRGARAGIICRPDTTREPDCLVPISSNADIRHSGFRYFQDGFPSRSGRQERPAAGARRRAATEGARAESRVPRAESRVPRATEEEAVGLFDNSRLSRPYSFAPDPSFVGPPRQPARGKRIPRKPRSLADGALTTGAELRGRPTPTRMRASILFSQAPNPVRPPVQLKIRRERASRAQA